MTKKILAVTMAAMMVAGTFVSTGYAKDVKIGYVDLRRAFYEYEKTKDFETSLNDVTEQRQKERTDKVTAITKLRDEMDLLNGDAKTKKQAEVEEALANLQNYDRETRQMLLNQKNDMFRQVIDDIQKIVEAIGKKDGYDYVLDSRNIMYANESFDLTDAVIKQLNKK